MVEAEAATLLARCILADPAGQQPQLVLVGDIKQLPATVISQRAAQQGYSRSLFERLQQRGSHVPLQLNMQYRCRPEISAWPRQQFYGGQLQDGPHVLEPSYGAALLQPLAGSNGSGGAEGLPFSGPFGMMLDVPGSFEKQGRINSGSVAGRLVANSYSNPMEADTVSWLLQHLVKKYSAIMGAAAAAAAPITVGVITPYKRQVATILQQCMLLTGKSTAANSSSESSSSSSSSSSDGNLVIGPLQVDVRSVDGFQRQERDVIIFSAVRANKFSSTRAMGFTADARRLNVALTRARNMLIVVCNACTVSNDPLWEGLLESAQAQGVLRVVDCLNAVRPAGL
jgi:senataxin